MESVANDRATRWSACARAGGRLRGGCGARRYRNLARKDASGEPFRSLEAMLNIAEKGVAYVVSG